MYLPACQKVFDTPVFCVQQARQDGILLRLRFLLKQKFVRRPVKARTPTFYKPLGGG